MKKPRQRISNIYLAQKRARLLSHIVARIRKFNFGPKDGVPQMTILCPVDVLSAR
jgi:hypothetical protein